MRKLDRLLILLFLLALGVPAFAQVTRNYTLRIQEADWDFGSPVGVQKVICYHQYVDATGVAVPVGTVGGAWEPFIPGPVIRANVGDTVRVRVGLGGGVSVSEAVGE